MLRLFQSLQNNFHYSMKDLLSMSALEFETMMDSLSLKGGNNSNDNNEDDDVADQEAEEMTIDQAYPQFFTDPFAGKERNK